MEAKSPLSKKVNTKQALFVVAVLAIPAFFWFRFLYDRFVTAPDQISPQMAKMRDAMMQRSVQYAETHKAAAHKTAASTQMNPKQKGGTKAAP